MAPNNKFFTDPSTPSTSGAQASTSSTTRLSVSPSDGSRANGNDQPVPATNAGSKRSAALTEDAEELAVTRPQENPTGFLSWWTLKNKATLLAVALGTLPVLIVGGISTAIAGKQLSQEAIEQQQQFTNAIALNMQDAGTRPPASDETVIEGSLSEKILNSTELRDLSRLVNQRIATLRQGMDSEGGSLQFSVVDERRNQVLISNNQADINTAIETLFPEYTNLSDRDSVATFKSVSTRDNRLYLITYAPVENTGNSGNELGVLVYQPMSEVFSAQQSLVFTLLSGTVLTALLVSTLAAYLANRATRPIIAASKAVAKLGQGRFDTRLEIEGNDELAVLNSNINVMAEQLEYQLEFIEDTAKRQGLFQAQAAIAEQQVQAKASMQRELRRLVQSVEGITKGDLTVQAELSDGEVGRMGDLFNMALAQLRKLVAEARQTSWQVTNALESNQANVQQLAQTTLSQTDELSGAIAAIEQISLSVESVASSAEQAQRAAGQAVTVAQNSEQTMAMAAEDATERQVMMAETTNRIKLLGTAAQQVSQVVSLINEVALKTNLLAINASIGTKQTNDAGEGFAMVASEIGQLTDQTTRATREIERVVKSIQSESKEISRALELDNTQATAEAVRLNEARDGLAQAIEASDEMNSLIRSISDVARSQRMAAQKVNTLMKQMTASSQRTSEVTQQTEDALKSTTDVAQQLAAVVQNFKLDA